MYRQSKLFFRRPFKYTYSHATLGLILVNFAIFAISVWMPELYRRIQAYGSLSVVGIAGYHYYWQFVTYMFIHGNFQHVLFNMIALLAFGMNLERVIGSKEFVLFYFVTGILDGVLSYVIYRFTGQHYVMLMGASGAIYAVLFAYAVVFPRSIIFIWGLIPVPAPILVLLYAIIEFCSEFFGIRANVGHLTHLFGFLFAWLYFVIRIGMHPLKVWKNTFNR